MPFELKEIIIKSSINYKDVAGKEVWNLELSQDNDFYFYLEKNSENKDIKIEKVSIENLRINTILKLGDLKVYIPTSNEIETMYKESKESYIGKDIVFKAGAVDNLSAQEISENGGMICFRISSEKIGTYKSSKAKKVTYDGNFLKELGIDEEDLQFSVNFDFIIETDDGVKYKTNLEYNLPVDKFEDSNSSSRVINDFSSTIFKRD